MKKRTFLLTMASMLVAGPELLKAQASPAKKKSLVAYFSRRGYNYLNGEIVFLQVGNTEVVAKKIRELTGSDLFQIETVKSYPEDYNETTTVAKKEQNENARPELTRTVDGMDDYDHPFLYSRRKRDGAQRRRHKETLSQSQSPVRIGYQRRQRQ